MPPQKSLHAFLATARAALTAPRSAPLHFVVGNEAADLDSLCSALFLAYFRSHTLPHVPPYIPLCHIPRADLALRPEFAAVLRRAGVTPDDVLSLSELEAAEKGGEGLRPADARWLLVDHNVLTGRLGRVYGAGVVGCVDHHEDEGVVPRGAETRVVEKAGSCMSLVVEECRETWEGLAREEGEEGEKERASINEQLAYLALAPILVDTANLANRDKTTPHDVRAVEIAEGYIPSASPSSTATATPTGTYDRAAFFAALSALKEDISSMSVRDVLRKDYKEWAEAGAKLGTASVPQSFAFLIGRAGGEEALVRELETWAKGMGLDVAAVLTTSRDDGGAFARELLVWAGGEPRGVRAAEGFVGLARERLGLGAWRAGTLDRDAGDGDGSWMRCWVQGRVEYSRKQIAPMLRDALKEA
ncbi:DHH phosphoesterase [Annulohypoxylon bovei var. microspora]|nr:DHH phosphoesterase [Annulohypoxylon bovei var. microspora]